MAIVAITLFVQWIIHGGTIPPVAEHGALSERYGSAGTLAWLVQVIYYVAEVAVVALIIGFGQKPGEGRFRRTGVPWGGILFALTWGLVHILTQGFSTAVYAAGLSLIMGIIYLLTGRSLLITNPILLVLVHHLNLQVAASRAPRGR